WPIFNSVRRRISQGPASNPIARAVAQASKARNVMYSTTPKARKCSSDSQRASSSSMVVLADGCARQQRLHHALHVHAARALHQNVARTRGQDGRKQRIQCIERLAARSEGPSRGA